MFGFANNLSRLTWASAALVTLAISGPADADFINIDMFDDPLTAGELVVTPTTTMATDISVGADILGTRTVNLTHKIGEGTVTAKVFNSGRFSYNEDSETDGELVLTWDFTPIDMTDGGKNDRFTIGVFSSDAGTFPNGSPAPDIQLTVSVRDNGGNVATHSITLITDGFNGERDYTFANFNGGPVDFTNLNQVKVVADTAAFRSTDLSLDFIQARAVPAPAALPAGLALLGSFGWIRRRHRRLV